MYTISFNKQAKEEKIYHANGSHEKVVEYKYKNRKTTHVYSHKFSVRRGDRKHNEDEKNFRKTTTNSPFAIPSLSIEGI